MTTKISVVGLGKLGACMAATFAKRGFEVLGIDTNPEVVTKINSDVPPVSEPGLGELMSKAPFRATTDPRSAADTDATFVIVPTPSRPDGSFSPSLLLRAVEPVATACKGKEHLFVICSTTTPGDCASTIQPTLREWTEGASFDFCYNPQFIALGDVIRGLLEPELVLIGGEPQSRDRLEALYQDYHLHQPTVTYKVSLITAELTKISLNSYITMKISFTNQIRLLADRYGANTAAILDAVGSDSRVGKKYLKPGLSYGGPCFPRDNRLLSYAAKQVGISAPLAEASDAINEMTKQWLLRNAMSYVLSGQTALILGMAYRPGTNVTEESAGSYLAEALKCQGVNVLVHDYAAKVDGVSDRNIKDLAGVAAIFICCPWDGYKTLELPAGVRVFDPWGMRRCSP